MRIGIVGCGLIGGSVGYSARAAGHEAIGYDLEPTASAKGVELGAFDSSAPDAGALSTSVDVLVVCVPVDRVVEVIATVAADAPRGLIVCDTASVKAGIVSELAAEPAIRYVGTHPMAGTEGEGIEAARPGLFESATWFLTPIDSTDADAYRTVHNLVASFGATPTAVDPETHDRWVALASHLPYAVANAIASVAAQQPAGWAKAAAGGFRDLTRVAGSNPALWSGILRTNADAVVESLDHLTDELSKLRAAVASHDTETITALIESARQLRSRIPVKGDRHPTSPHLVEVSVPDTAGALSKVTLCLSESSINIEDLWLDHLPSGGVVKLIIDTEADARSAVASLADAGLAAYWAGPV